MSISKLETIQLKNKLFIKRAILENNQEAAYWFQSPTSTTDDYSTRVWEEIKNGQKDWVLASVVFDTNMINKKETQNFLKNINTSINHYFLNKNLP